MSSAPKSAPKPALDRPQPKTEPTVEELQEMYDGDDFVLGIDEAGRGPVLGPMVYGCAFCRLRDWDRVKALGVADSKKMTEANRDKVAAKIRASEFCEFITVSLHARDISAWMQQRGGDTTLNTVSHDCAIYLIDSVLQATGGPCSMADTDQKVAWCAPRPPLAFVFGRCSWPLSWRGHSVVLLRYLSLYRRLWLSSYLSPYLSPYLRGGVSARRGSFFFPFPTLACFRPRPPPPPPPNYLVLRAKGVLDHSNCGWQDRQYVMCRPPRCGPGHTSFYSIIPKECRHGCHVTDGYIALHLKCS